MNEKEYYKKQFLEEKEFLKAIREKIIMKKYISDQLFAILVKNTDGPIDAISELIETLVMILASSSDKPNEAFDEICRMLKSCESMTKFDFYRLQFAEHERKKHENEDKEPE